MATAKDCHTLTGYFEKCFKARYGQKPTVNKYAARWGFDSVLSDMSVAEAKALVDYYFTTTSNNRHTLDWFFYNYHSLITSKNMQQEDAARRAALRAASEERAAKWKERLGHQGIANHQFGSQE